MEGGSHGLTTRHEKIAPLLGIAQGDPKFISRMSIRFRGLAQHKAGRSAPAESSTRTLLPTPANDQRCNRACLFPGRTLQGIVLSSPHCQEVLLENCIPPSQPSEISLQKVPRIARRSSALFFAISAVHESFPYKTYGKLFSAEQSE